MFLFTAFVLIGSITGITAGLLGVGGGLIVVPSLAALFSLTAPNNPWLMQVAIGTSLATIIPTSISSLLAHYRRGAISFPDVKRLAPGLMIGALSGAWIASRIDTHFLKTGFGIFVLLVAVQMLAGLRPRQQLKGSPRSIIGAAIGLVSALVGIGGGSMTVPYLVWNGRDMRNAIATSAACGLPIAVAATMGYIATGLGKTSHLTGFVHLPAFFEISLASILTAPLGAKLAHTLPVSSGECSTG